jgi:long-chain fatty acid transport protein
MDASRTHDMRRLAIPAAALLVATIALPAPAVAGGILLYENGAPDVALASAGIGARAQDASTVLTNPAGMTRLPGTQLLLAPQALYGSVAFAVGAGTSPGLGAGGGGNAVGWLPGGGAYLTVALPHGLTAGLAAVGTFGLALTYDDGWAGRYYAKSATLVGVSFLPSLAWRASDHLSIGASLNAMYGVSKQKVGVNQVTAADAELSLDSTTWGFGANLGVLWEPGTATRLGLTWNSPVKLDFSAQPKFTGLTPALQALLEARGLTSSRVNLGIEVPQGVMLSAYQELGPQWALLASAGWQQWSRFGQVEAGISDTSDPTSLTTDLSFKDTWHGALGAQFAPAPGWRIDGGIAYDSSMQDTSSVSPMLPAGEAWRFGAGLHHQATASFAWGLSAEYAYGGTLGVNKQSTVPVALGGRGDLAGRYVDTGIFFAALQLEWRR